MAARRVHSSLTARLSDATAVCCQLSNIIDVEKPKNTTEHRSSSLKGRDNGFVLLSYVAANGSFRHFEVEWLNHDHKARIQKLWELLDKYSKLTAAGKGQRIASLSERLAVQSVSPLWSAHTDAGGCVRVLWHVAVHDHVDPLPTEDQVKAQLQAMVRSDEEKESKSKRGGKKKKPAKENDGGADDGSDGSYQPTTAHTGAMRGSVSTPTQHHRCSAQHAERCTLTCYRCAVLVRYRQCAFDERA